MDDDARSAGAVLGGRYELGGVLGRGGMGTVREATDLRLGRSVAVKILRPELADQARARRRFEAEARAAARLVHPNVVTVFDSGEDGEIPFLVMERLAGASLADEMASGPLPVARVLLVADEVLAALDAAHRAGIIHRDIKPGNVLLADGDHVKVSDFGIAKTIDDVDQTQTIEVVATLAYVAPERLAGEDASPRSDLYSLGVLLHEALSGQRLFREATPLLSMRAIERGAPEPLASVRPEVPPYLAEVVERAMARDPLERFASAAEMAAALDREHEPAPTRPIDVPTEPSVVPAAETVSADTVSADTVSDDTVLVGADAGADATETRFLARLDTPSAQPPARGARRRTGVIAGAAVAVVGLVALGVALRGNDNHASGPTTPTGAGTAVTTTLPQPLESALDRLEQDIAK